MIDPTPDEVDICLLRLENDELWRERDEQQRREVRAFWDLQHERRCAFDAERRLDRLLRLWKITRGVLGFFGAILFGGALVYLAAILRAL